MKGSRPNPRDEQHTLKTTTLRSCTLSNRATVLFFHLVYQETTGIKQESNCKETARHLFSLESFDQKDLF